MPRSLIVALTGASFALLWGLGQPYAYQLDLYNGFLLPHLQLKFDYCH